MERTIINQPAVTFMRQGSSSASICMIITADEKGNRHNRPMGAVKIDDDGSCWFFASKSSGKLKDIAVNNKIQIVFANPDTENYIEVHGEGAVTCDEKEIEDKWSPLVSTWFRDGIKDPEICLVRMIVTGIFYWDEVTGCLQQFSIKTAAVVEDQRLAA